MPTPTEQVDTTLYQPVMTEILDVLTKYDPVGIVSVQAGTERTQAYSPEARVVVERLRNVDCPNALRQEVDKLLHQWFGPSISWKNQYAKYDELAHEICSRWLAFKSHELHDTAA